MWIHPLVEQTRRLAFARGIDAGKEHDHGKLGVQQLLLRVEELGTQDGDLSLVDFLFEFPSDFSRFEHPPGMVLVDALTRRVEWDHASRTAAIRGTTLNQH